MGSRRLLTVAALLLIFTRFAGAQVLEPVTWSFRSEKTAENSYDIVMTAAIEDKWHLYAMDLPEGGPIATSFTFETPAGYSLEGKPIAVNAPEVKFDNSFGMEIGMHSGTAEFRQKIAVKELPVTVSGFVTFMSCDDTQCLPPRDVEFSVVIGGGETTAAADNAVASGTVTSSPDNQPKKGFLKFFLLSMLAGFAGILTPCVFPMIPMTVAFFSQGGGSKGSAIGKALIFGLSIVLLYSSLGIIVSLTSAGAGFANTLSTHWIPNLLFFTLFLVFAASFFGAFEIVLPSKWVSTSDSKVDRGGALAAFFLGLTTVLVSFSCTGPIVGALLVEAASGDVLRPTIGMFGFGLAFALPFTLFALFPSWMQKMPKSGGWLNSVKVVLGFIMLAFSLKFASTVDTVYNLGILSRDIYLAIWIVLFVLLGIYLMGKIKFSHDSDVPHIGVVRLVLIIASFTFALYLVPG
ncbi:MAG: cytochrome c biogenesis protein CcdA, partial [Bacteroidota bacterium]|nr:cytochrome c biogenesis protein CcdA [Bacteroidota bacterium]